MLAIVRMVKQTVMPWVWNRMRVLSRKNLPRIFVEEELAAHFHCVVAISALDERRV